MSMAYDIAVEDGKVVINGVPFEGANNDYLCEWMAEVDAEIDRLRLVWQRLCDLQDEQRRLDRMSQQLEAVKEEQQ